MRITEKSSLDSRICSFNFDLSGLLWLEISLKNRNLNKIFDFYLYSKA